MDEGTNPHQPQTPVSQRRLPLRPVDSFVTLGSATFGGQDSLASLPLGSIAVASEASSSHHLDVIEKQDLESRMLADFTSKYGPSHQNVLDQREEQAEIFSHMR